MPPRAARLRDESNPSPLSSWLFVPGTTREHADEPATALQHARPTGVGSYLRDTPSLRHLKHEVDLETSHRSPHRPPQTFPD